MSAHGPALAEALRAAVAAGAEQVRRAILHAADLFRAASPSQVREWLEREAVLIRARNGMAEQLFERAGAAE